MFYPPDLASSEHTLCRLHEALGTVASHSQPHSELYLGFILIYGSEDIGLARTFSPNDTQTLVLASCGVRPSRRFKHLDTMLPACSTNHSKIG